MMSWFQKSKLSIHIAICAAAENQPEKKFGGGRIFLSSRIFGWPNFFLRIFGGSNFFGDGGQIRRLRGLGGPLHYWGEWVTP